jgi:beta-phosphoglucomutase-like phosphatase (HAD superfamily)
VTREDYPDAKPAPDAYLAAAQRLGCPPAECLVVEDSQRGLAAGLAAGMRVVVVPSDFTRTQDFTGSTRRLASLDELTHALLRELW